MLPFDQQIHDGNYVLDFGEMSLRSRALVKRDGIFAFLGIEKKACPLDRGDMASLQEAFVKKSTGALEP